MDYTEEQERAFVKGFNSGYVLEQYEPSLTHNLLKGVGDSKLPFVQGMRYGSKEFQKEAFKDRLRQAQTHDRAKDQDEGHENAR